MKLLARTIQNPYEIWRVPVEVNGKRYPEMRLIRLFSGPDGQVGGYTVFSLIHGRMWSATTAYTPKVGLPENVMRKYLEERRVGTLWYREESLQKYRGDSRVTGPWSERPPSDPPAGATDAIHLRDDPKHPAVPGWPDRQRPCWNPRQGEVQVRRRCFVHHI